MLTSFGSVCSMNWRNDFEAFRRDGDYSERRVLQFAKTQGIAPGIVVGRMQLEGMIPYSMLNNLKEKYEIAV